MDIHCEIIPGIVDFEPVFNSKYSFVNDSVYKRTGLDAGLIFHIILFALVWLILFLQYRFFKGIAPQNKMLDISFSFFTASAICAYLGILVWKKGMLDFLHFKLWGHIICDLKDIYINCYVVLLVISTTKIAKEHNVKVKDMVAYIKGLFGKMKEI
jgi:hypothetical protein